RQLGRTASVEVQLPFLRQELHPVTQFLQHRGGIEGLDLTLFMSSLEARKARDILEQRMQRRNILAEHPDEAVAQGIGDAFEAQARSGVDHHAQISAQIMCSLLPKERAFPLHGAHLRQGLFEVANVSLSLDLLQAEILCSAFNKAIVAYLRPQAPGRRHYGG